MDENREALLQARIRGLEAACRNAEDTARRYVTQWHEGAGLRNALLSIVQKARGHSCAFTDPLVEIAQSALDKHDRQTAHRPHEQGEG